jgi:hypothetical protein
MTSGPIIMDTVGDTFAEASRVLLFIWEGATSAGDTISVHAANGIGTLLWAARTPDTQTYLGANFGPSGIPAPDGFKLTQISAGRLLVYLRED